MMQYLQVFELLGTGVLVADAAVAPVDEADAALVAIQLTTYNDAKLTSI
jgi:hypothetical protein